jgi:hypothetical protein
MKIIIENNLKSYKESLKQEILKKIDKKITIILSFNYLNQYMFDRKDIKKVSENLFFSRVEQPYDLLAILKEIHFNPYFKISNTIIMTPYNHLIKHEQKLKEKINIILERLENRYKKEIIQFEFDKKWDTQYHLNEILSTQSLTN